MPLVGGRRSSRARPPRASELAAAWRRGRAVQRSGVLTASYPTDAMRGLRTALAQHRRRTSVEPGREQDLGRGTGAGSRSTIAVRAASPQSDRRRPCTCGGRWVPVTAVLAIDHRITGVSAVVVDAGGEVPGHRHDVCVCAICRVAESSRIRVTFSPRSCMRARRDGGSRCANRCRRVGPAGRLRLAWDQRSGRPLSNLIVRPTGVPRRCARIWVNTSTSSASGPAWR